MAENNSNIYYGSGISVAGNIDIGAVGKPADSRVMVKSAAGLTELQAAKRVYDGMIVYVEDTHTYHKCRVDWDDAFNITACSWTEVVIKSEEDIKNLIASEIPEVEAITDAEIEAVFALVFPEEVNT